MYTVETRNDFEKAEQWFLDGTSFKVKRVLGDEFFRHVMKGSSRLLQATAFITRDKNYVYYNEPAAIENKIQDSE